MGRRHRRMRPSRRYSPAPTGFRYDSLRDEYMFEWKTDKDWQGTCRVFVLGLADGTDAQPRVPFQVGLAEVARPARLPRRPCADGPDDCFAVGLAS